MYSNPQIAKAEREYRVEQIRRTFPRKRLSRRQRRLRDAA